MAARILSAEAESEDAAARHAAQRLEDRGDPMSPAVHAADKAQAIRGAGEEQSVVTRNREERDERPGEGARATQVEDQTLVELRQAFHTEIGRAHVCTPITKAQHVVRPLLEK